VIRSYHNQISIKFVVTLIYLSAIFKQNRYESVNIIPVVLIALSSFTARAQDQAKIPEGISIAIKAGNAAELSKYMNSTLSFSF